MATRGVTPRDAAGRRDLTPPPGPLGHLLTGAAAKRLRLRVDTPEGARILSGSDLVRIARDPGLLASGFGCPLAPGELATRLEARLPDAAPGALVDLTSGAPAGALVDLTSGAPAGAQVGPTTGAPAGVQVGLTSGSALAPAVAAEVREPRPGATREPPVTVATEPALRRPAAPPPLASGADRSGTTTSARRDAARVLTSPGFTLLDDAHRSALVRLLASADPVLAGPARRAVLDLVGSAAFRRQTPSEQAAALTRLLDEQPPGKGPIGAIPGGYEVSRAYELMGPTEVRRHDFGSQITDARCFLVVVDDTRLPVYVAKTREGDPNHDIHELADGLSRVPPGVLVTMREVRLQPTRNPADAYWSEVFGEAGFTSYMTAGASGVVDVWVKGAARPQDVAASLVHETGHILSQRQWGAGTDARWSTWNAAMVADAVRPSGYAKNSPGEDFSESLSLYSSVKGGAREAAYRALMPRRFAILDELTRSGPEASSTATR